MSEVRMPLKYTPFSFISCFALSFFPALIVTTRKDIEKCTKIRIAVKDAIAEETAAAKEQMMSLIVSYPPPI